MQSPASAQSGSQPTSQHISSQQNGSSADGAVQSSDSQRSGDAHLFGANGRDSIHEQKEKAKAVMAASGVNVASHSKEGQTANSQNGKSPEHNTRVANGTTSPSRKRSRSGSRIPLQQPQQDNMDQSNQASIQEYLLHQTIQRDASHAAAMNDQFAQMRTDVSVKKAEKEWYTSHRMQRQQWPGQFFGYGYSGFGNGSTEHKPAQLVYPEKRKRPGGRTSRALQISRKDKQRQSEQLEELVPIRLDIEHDKIKLRDTFTWNLHDRVVSPDIFIDHLIEDFKIPTTEGTAALVKSQIQREFQEQLQDHYPHIHSAEESLDPSSPYFAYKNDEMRILIKLNITIGQHTLVDQFEWDLNNPENSPEEFARLTARELALSGEFTTAIAHSIHEQCQMYTKSLYITGHQFDGRPVEDGDIRDSMLPSPLPTVFRPQQSAKDYAPYLWELNETDMERTEVSMLREQRRAKRSTNRRGGPALPDLKDRQRTVRTLLVSTVLPGAAEDIADSRLFKVSRAAGGRGRRATGRAGEEDDSEDSDGSDSAPESPAPSQLIGGTARTRAIRGAANAAQAAITRNLGRSATPEIASLHHHETRTARRSAVPDREDSVPEPTSLLVKLRINPARFRAFLMGGGRNRLGPPGSHANTPQRVGMPPPPSPALTQISTPGPAGASPKTKARNPPASGKQWRYFPDGSAETEYPQPSELAPPPPWLTTAIDDMHKKYPEDLFEAVMRYSAIDKTNQQPVRLDSFAGKSPPPNVAFKFLPRVRCNDCPGKVYNAGPEHTIENFEMHLKNRAHRQKVEDRKRKG